jgi:hypothetical protein
VRTGADLRAEELAQAHWPLTRAPYLSETNRPGVFAVGGVRSGSVRRVALGVGEGSICVQFVHRALGATQSLSQPVFGTAPVIRNTWRMSRLSACPARLQAITSRRPLPAATAGPDVQSLNVYIPALSELKVECGMPLMRQYNTLFEDRNSRRTIADVVDVLHQVAGFGEHDRAQIRIGPLRLPSGDVTGLVGIFFDASDPEQGYAAWLPTSDHCRAIPHGSSQRHRFEILRLVGAVVDAEANVQLADGTRLRALEVQRTRMPNEPTELDWRIVHYTLEFIGATHCYRALWGGVPPPEHHLVPDLRFLDCSRLSDLDVPSLEAIANYIAKKDPTLRKLSRQKIADALRTFGIRLPTARPRVTSAPH